MTEPAFLIAQIAALLPRFAYYFSDEAMLHAGISGVLKGADIEFKHEHVAGPEDRFDFLCGSIVIEAKVKGSYPTALRQVDRYLARDDVDGVVLVTTRHWGRFPNKQELRGKPLYVVQVRSQAF